MKYPMMMGAGLTLVQLLSENSCGDVDSDLDGWTVSDGDCNDMDASVYPGATDVCDDGIDSNCDHVGCEPRGIISLDSAHASLVGEEPYVWSGWSIAGPGDVNGDGWDDVLVGAVFGSAYAGNAYVVYGPMEGTISLADADARMTGEFAEDSAGMSVGSAGDINKDGFADVMVGAPYAKGGLEVGAAYLLYGPVEGDISLSEADLHLTGIGLEDGLGGSVGSINPGKGAARQLLVGAWGEDSGGSNAGCIYVFPDGQGELSASSASARLVGDTPEGGLGPHLGLGGDYNGDGVEDLLLSAPAAAGSSDSLKGRVYVVYGPLSASMSLADADAMILAEEGGNLTGRGIASAGDVNADGYDDILVGAPKAGGGGEVYLFYGPVLGSLTTADADLTLSSEEINDLAGIAVTSAGDLNRDGYGDFVVGASYGAELKGKAYLFYGPLEGNRNLASADATFLGISAGDFAGQTLARAGDVNADGYPDLLVGAPGRQAQTGTTYVILGHGY